MMAGGPFAVAHAALSVIETSTDDGIIWVKEVEDFQMKNWKLLYEGIAHVLQQPTNKVEYYFTDAFQYTVEQGAKIRVIDVEGWYGAGHRLPPRTECRDRCRSTVPTAGSAT